MWNIYGVSPYTSERELYSSEVSKTDAEEAMDYAENEGWTDLTVLYEEG